MTGSMVEASDSKGGAGGLVIVTGDGSEHRFVASRIAAIHPVRAILLCEPPPRRAWHRVLRRAPLRFLDKALWRVFLRVVGDRRSRTIALADVLGPDSTAFPPGIPIIPVGRPRVGQLEAVLVAHAPDVIAVYGTGLVPDAALAQARQIALNLHTGISPQYRGTDSAFWPIHNGEPKWVGATVHECIAALDGGRIFATCHAPPRMGDDLHRIFARAVRAGAEAYVGVIALALAGSIEGVAQDLSQGREYTGTERGFVSEIHARRRLARMQADFLPLEQDAAP